MKKQKLHIISFDGLAGSDMAFLKTQKNFARLLDGAAYSFEVEGVYPTITYPSHTSITTGNYPSKHGIVNNTLLQPQRKKPDWFWFARDIKTKTFQQLASENNFSILSLLWPVTARAKIKYNLPEIFANRPYLNQIMVSMYAGSKLFQIKLIKKFGSILKGFKEPELDDFTMESWLYSFDNYKTDITMVHLIDLDSQRHDYGFSSKEAKAALLRHDKRLGQILNKIETSGEAESTSLIVLGDHSSMDAHSIIFLNKVLKDANFLSGYDESISEYKLVAKSGGGSSYIYTNAKNPLYKTQSEKEKLFTEVQNLIKSAIPEKAIEAFYTSEEAERLGADSNCFMMLEANEGFLFEDGIAPEPLMSIEALSKTNLSYHTNNHGYSPFTKKNYETVFIAKGKNIKQNVNIGKMSLVDEGPTFAALLGLSLGKTDGRVLTEVLDF
ncbi:MAG: ectonucleotide pyrophosphatase/phosphodiesterase [Treponemataceae bacterium]